MGRLCAKLAAAKAKEVCAGKQKDMFCYSFSFSSSLYPCLRDIMSLLLSNADRASDVEFPGYFHFEERNCSTIVTLTTNHLFFRPLLCILHISKNNPPAPLLFHFSGPKKQIHRSNFKSKSGPKPSADAPFAEWSAFMEAEWTLCYVDDDHVYMTDVLHTPFECSRCLEHHLDCTPPHLQGCPKKCSVEQESAFDTACARGLANANFADVIPKLGLLTEDAPSCMLVDNVGLEGVGYNVWSDDVFVPERWEGLCTILLKGQDSCPRGFRTCADLIPVKFLGKNGEVAVKGLTKFEGKCSREAYYRGKTCGCNIDAGTNVCNPCIAKHLANMCLPYDDDNVDEGNSTEHDCYAGFESCEAIVAKAASSYPAPPWKRPARSNDSLTQFQPTVACPSQGSQANGGSGSGGFVEPGRRNATTIAVAVLLTIAILVASIVVKVRRDNRHERNAWANGGGTSRSSADGSRTVQLMERNENFELTESGEISTRNNTSWNRMNIVGRDAAGDHHYGNNDTPRPQISMHTIADAQYAAEDEEC